TSMVTFNIWPLLCVSKHRISGVFPRGCDSAHKGCDPPHYYGIKTQRSETEMTTESDIRSQSSRVCVRIRPRNRALVMEEQKPNSEYPWGAAGGVRGRGRRMGAAEIGGRWGGSASLTRGTSASPKFSWEVALFPEVPLIGLQPQG